MICNIELDEEAKIGANNIAKFQNSKPTIANLNTRIGNLPCSSMERICVFLGFRDHLFSKEYL